MTIGLDLLGLGSTHWNIADTVKLFSEQSVPINLGFFDGGWPNAFGDPTSHVQSILATGKVAAIRVHMWWDPSHGIASLGRVQARSQKWQQFALTHPTLRVYLSPSCEYKGSLQEITALVQAIKNLAPNCIPVCCPMQSPVVPGCLTEAHGAPLHTNANQLASFDGAGCADRDVTTWLQNTAQSPIQFLWHYRFNMAESGNTLPPDQRTASPDYNYMKGILRLASPLGVPPAPTFHGNIHPLQAPNLWKTYAEDMSGTNSRDDKPLLELNGVSADHINIICSNGLNIGALKHFSDVRFYSGLSGGIGLYGWQISDKAVALSGSPWIWFNQPGTQNYWGPVNANFRAGFFEH